MQAHEVMMVKTGNRLVTRNKKGDKIMESELHAWASAALSVCTASEGPRLLVLNSFASYGVLSAVKNYPLTSVSFSFTLFHYSEASQFDG